MARGHAGIGPTMAGRSRRWQAGQAEGDPCRYRDHPAHPEAGSDTLPARIQQRARHWRGLRQLPGHDPVVRSFAVVSPQRNKHRKTRRKPPHTPRQMDRQGVTGHGAPRAFHRLDPSGAILDTTPNQGAVMTVPAITDSHCHLDFPDFDAERPEVIARALRAGVHRMVTICTRLRNVPQVRAIAEAHDPVFFAAGTHPMSAAAEPLATVEDLLALTEHPKFVAIGETGLDYHYTADSADIQRQSLRAHIEAAQESGLPLIIHARDADEDMIRILSEGHRAQPYTCVMHCFSSGAALARRALDLGFYLSMSGIATFPKSQELRDIFASAPLDRILVETDSPYLAPPPHRGKRNEPAYTAHTARVGADVFGMDYADFAARTEANFDRLFWKAAQYKAAA